MPIGMTELIVILFIILLLFGARKLPDLAAGLGGAVNSFKKALKGDEAEPKTIEGHSIDRGSADANDKVPSAKSESKS